MNIFWQIFDFILLIGMLMLTYWLGRMYERIKVEHTTHYFYPQILYNDLNGKKGKNLIGLDAGTTSNNCNVTSNTWNLTLNKKKRHNANISN